MVTVSRKYNILIKPILGTNESLWLAALLNLQQRKKNSKINKTKINIYDVPHLKKFGVRILRDEYSLLDAVNIMKSYFSIVTVKHPLSRIEAVFSDHTMRDSTTTKEIKVKKQMYKKMKKNRKLQKAKDNDDTKAFDSDSDENETVTPSQMTKMDENKFQSFLDKLIAGRLKNNEYLWPYDDAFPCLVPFK